MFICWEREIFFRECDVIKGSEDTTETGGGTPGGVVTEGKKK